MLAALLASHPYCYSLSYLLLSLVSFLSLLLSIYFLLT